MLKFAEVLREAGIMEAYTHYPKCSEISIHLFDGKNREFEGEHIQPEALFLNNQPSLMNLETFIKGLEQETIESMNVKIDDNNVILFYKNSRAIAFPRNQSMDSMYW